MDTPCRVFLVGSSIFILALEAALLGLPEVISARAHPRQLERLTETLRPACVAIVFEHGALSHRLQSRLAQSGHALISLDVATGLGTRNDGRRRLIAEVQDLLQLARGDRA